jgi:hypothetical protein
MFIKERKALKIEYILICKNKYCYLMSYTRNHSLNISTKIDLIFYFTRMRLISQRQLVPYKMDKLTNVITMYLYMIDEMCAYMVNT